MKDEVINAIVVMLSELGVDTGDIANRLYVLLKDVEISRAETALAVRNDLLNENLLKRFLAAKAVKGCTENTIIAYKNTLSYILKRFNKSVVDFTTDDIRVYIAYRLTQCKISKSFMNTEIRYLRSFFAWLALEEIVPNNPMLKIDSVKAPKVKKKAFTDIECEKIRSACRTSMEQAIVEILFSTGCRVSEVCAIKLEEIDGEKVIVHGKGNKDRQVYLNAKAQIAIQQYLKDRHDKNPYLFPAGIYAPHQAGKKPSRNRYWYKNAHEVSEKGMRDKGAIEATVRRVGKRAGVENTHPHRFRRTCATMALRRGMPIEMVSKMLGHENIATTQIYLDLSEHDLEESHKKFVV